MSVKNGLMVMAGILFVATLVGCGSVSSTGSTESGAASRDSQGGTIAGKVGILIKDDMLTHPSSTSKDIPELSQLWVTLNRVSLKKDGEMEDE